MRQVVWKEMDWEKVCVQKESYRRVVMGKFWNGNLGVVRTKIEKSGLKSTLILRMKVCSLVKKDKFS